MKPKTLELPERSLLDMFHRRKGDKIEQIGDLLLQEALFRFSGHQRMAAQALGISRRAFNYRLGKLGLRVKDGFILPWSTTNFSGAFLGIQEQRTDVGSPRPIGIRVIDNERALALLIAGKFHVREVTE